jgi:8-oxo-dGTP pyrophosphatase MutT (NUDIX family)
MDVDRPAPGEALNPGSPTAPRQAATVVVARGGDEALEVLLVKRNPQQRFMGGAWVFPGGAVDAADGEGDAAHRLAAVREVREEAAIELSDPGALVKFARWITPAEVRVRFDTHFFLAPAPPDQDGHPDGAEVVDLRWFAPQAALDAYGREEILLVFPTIRTLEQLAGFASARDLFAWAGGRDVRPVQPRIIAGPRVVMPGEPGYDD